MFVGHQNGFCVRGIRVAKLVCLVLAAAGFGYVILTQSESAQSSAGIAQPNTTPPAAEFFPAGYVNQGKEVGEPFPTF